MQRRVLMAGVGVATVLFATCFLGAQSSAAKHPAMAASVVAVQARGLLVAPPEDDTAGLLQLPTPVPSEAAPVASAAPTSADPLVNIAMRAPAAAPIAAPLVDMEALAIRSVRLRTVPAPAAQPAAVAVVQRAAVEANPALPVAAWPAVLNGVPLSSVIVIPDAVKVHMRQIYALGQTQGRDARACAKVGDSTMAWPPLLAAFDDASAYRLGPYAPLQATIDYRSGWLGHNSPAVKKGMHTWSEFDPSWANAALCAPGEAPLACEFRRTNASVAIIRLGANDVSAPRLYEEQLRRIIGFFLERGTIPVLGTKPDRLEGPANTINKIVYRLAAEYSIPLWDYDLIAGTVPGKGLVSDHVHFSGIGSHDYASAAALNAGDSLEDLTALLMLDAVTRVVTAP